MATCFHSTRASCFRNDGKRGLLRRSTSGHVAAAALTTTPAASCTTAAASWTAATASCSAAGASADSAAVVSFATATAERATAAASIATTRAPAITRRRALAFFLQSRSRRRAMRRVPWPRRYARGGALGADVAAALSPGLYSLKKTLTCPSCRSSAAVLGRRASRTLYAKYEATARISVTTMETKMTVARMLTQSNLMTFDLSLDAAFASEFSPRHVEAHQLFERGEDLGDVDDEDVEEAIEHRVNGQPH